MVMKNFNFKKANLGDTHVYVLFIDGEVSLTKAGDLLGQRNLHMMKSAILDVHTMPRPIGLLAQFPDRLGGDYPCVYLDTEEEAEEYRQYLYDSVSEMDREAMFDYLKKHNYLSNEEEAYELLMKDVARLTETYAQCKGFQEQIRDYLKQHLGDAKCDKDELRVAYIKWCQQSEVVDWGMLDKSREMRDA